MTLPYGIALFAVYAYQHFSQILEGVALKWEPHHIGFYTPFTDQNLPTKAILPNTVSIPNRIIQNNNMLIYFQSTQQFAEFFSIHNFQFSIID